MAKEKKKAPVAAAKGDDADIFNNLHGAVGKTVMQKVLNSLTDHDQIASKTYNKQTDQFETPSEQELSEMDQKIEILKAEVAQVKDTNRQLHSSEYSLVVVGKIICIQKKEYKINALANLNQSLTNEQIKEKLKILLGENAKYEERLAILRSGTRQISADEKKKIDAEYEANRRLWKSRKVLFNEIFGVVTEYMPGNPREFAEEIGIEQDTVDINVDPLANI
ncbi:putative hop2 protein [Jimgerdemannia flammicorona]|uniref:Homologous-pairing protein 2 homolog n=1 Tax=Jimgerdemannia flammicorona TaxID=994334 RepID=A0A433DG68_9FUNG|nr:putative hop2 protein [Jimgerdemannia flammicorona]